MLRQYSRRHSSDAARDRGRRGGPAAASVFSASEDFSALEVSVVPELFPAQPAREHTIAAVNAAAIVFIVCFFMNLSPFLCFLVPKNIQSLTQLKIPERGILSVCINLPGIVLFVSIDCASGSDACVSKYFSV